MDTLRDRLAAGATAVVFLAFVVSIPVADHYLKRVPGNALARAFLVALRESRTEELRRLTTPDLAREMEHVTDATELGRSLGRLRSGALVELDVDCSAGETSVMDWDVGCVFGSIDGGSRFALAMRKVAGTWRIEDVRTETRSPLCVSNDVD